MTQSNGFWLGQWCGQPFSQKARTSASYRSVYGFQQAAIATARLGSDQFKIGTGGGVDKKRSTFLLSLRTHQRRTFRNLRFFDIGNSAGNGRKLSAAKLAETVQCRHIKITLNASFCGCAIKKRCCLWRNCITLQIKLLLELNIVKCRIRNGPLALIIPHYIGKEALNIGFSHPES